MKLISGRQNACDRAAGMVALVGLLAVTRSVEAQQQVLAPPPAFSLNPPAVEDYVTNQPGALQTAPLAAPQEATLPWLLWGPVTVHPHLLYRFLYGDGIQSAPGQTQTTAIQQFTPGMLFALGSHWTLDYSPMFSFYSSRSFENTTDQNVNLIWGTSYQDWNFGFSQGYTAVNDPMVETGAQTQTQSYSTTAKASYRFSSEVSADMSVAQNFSFSPGFTDSRAWSTLNWLNFDVAQKLDVGIGLGYDYYDVDPGPNMMDESIQGRVRWQATDKLGLMVHAGVVDQQYLEDAAPNLLSPLFGASVVYTPFTKTSLTLTADRAIAPSLFQGLVIESTSVGLALSQRLLKRLNFSVGAGYGRSDYHASTSTPAAGTGRVDNYYSLNLRLSTKLWERGSGSVFYQYSDNSSTISTFTFSSSQVGVELEYRF